MQPRRAIAESGRRIRLMGSALAGLVAALLGGCATSAPTFEVIDVAMTEQSADAVVLTFVVRGENRGKEQLPLRDVNYSLEIEGRQVFSGRRSAEATLPRFGTREIVLPVSVRTGAGQPLASPPTGTVPYSLSGSVFYEVPGAISEALFDAKLRRPRAGFREDGRMDFSTLPREAALPGPPRP